MRRKGKILLLWGMLFFVLVPGTARGDQDEKEETYWQEELAEYDLSSFDQVLEEVLPQSALTFSQVMEILIQGDTQAGWQALAYYMEHLLWGEWHLGKTVAWNVLLVGILGAVFTNLARAFPDGGVAQSGFVVFYVTVAALLLQGMTGALTIAMDGLEVIGTLMTAFCPVFFLVVAIQGQLTAAAMYEMALVLVQGVGWICRHGILSGIRLWVLLRLVEGLFTEPMWEHLGRMLGKGIRKILRVSFGAVIGFQAIQALLLPYLDGVKNGALWKVASAIPGVGNGVRTAAQLALGTAALLRNAMGMGGVVVLVAAALPSLMKLLSLGCLYHGLATLLQPITDRRIVSAVAAAGEGCLLLCRVLSMGVLLFGIFIGIVCACFGRAV